MTNIDPKAKGAYEAHVNLSIAVLVEGEHGQFESVLSESLDERIVAYVKSLLPGMALDAVIDGPFVRRLPGASRYHFPGEAYTVDAIPARVSLDYLSPERVEVEDKA